MKVSKEQFKAICDRNNHEPASVMSIIEVESPGKGFDYESGKIIIQFEPVWFERREPYAPSGLWSVNGVERQAKEWLAFNDAFNKAPDSAMQATSIGLPQIMGMHYARLGYKTVGEMWDDFKQDGDMAKGEYRQIEALCRFISSDQGLMVNLHNQYWYGVAVCYNGKYFRSLARKLGRTPYDLSLKQAFDKWSKIFPPKPLINQKMR